MSSISAAGNGPRSAINVAFILVAVVLPIFCLLVVSLHPVWQAEIIPGDLTLHNYVRTLFFWRPDHIAAATNGIYNSFILAFAGATIAMMLSLVVSYMIHRTKGFGARLLDFLCVVPVGFPGHRAGDGRAGHLHQDADLRDARGSSCSATSRASSPTGSATFPR